MVVERKGNEISTRVMNVIDEHFRRHRVSTCRTHIHVVKQGSSIESDFLSLLDIDSEVLFPLKEGALWRLYPRDINSFSCFNIFFPIDAPFVLSFC